MTSELELMLGSGWMCCFSTGLGSCPLFLGTSGAAGGREIYLHISAQKHVWALLEKWTAAGTVSTWLYHIAWFVSVLVLLWACCRQFWECWRTLTWVGPWSMHLAQGTDCRAGGADHQAWTCRAAWRQITWPSCSGGLIFLCTRDCEATSEGEGGWAGKEEAWRCAWDGTNRACIRV